MKRRRSIDEFLAEIKREVRQSSGDGGRKRAGSNGERGRGRRRASLLDFLAAPQPRPRTRPAPQRPPGQPPSASRAAPRPLLEPRPEGKGSSSAGPGDGEAPRRLPALHGGPRGVRTGSRGPSASRARGLVVEAGRRVAWFIGEKDDIVQEVSGYVLDVKYDPDARRAVLYFLLEDGRMVRWYDRSGHKPYFLVEADPSPELKSRLAQGEFEQVFAGFEVVVKYHAIKRRKMRLTKVKVEDPLAVRKMREIVKGMGLKYYEADIRYHHNYVYDYQLIPGMLHAAARRPGLEEHEPDPESVERVSQIFSDEPEEVRERAIRWLPLFEQKPPEPRMIAVDIEVYTPFEGELPDPESAPYPVISIALADSEGMRRVLVLDRPDAPGRLGPDSLREIEGEVEIFDDEAAMILEAFRIMEEYPVIVTFNGDSFDVPYLYNRLIVLGVPPELIPVEFHQDSASFKNNLHLDLYKLFDIRALQVYAFGNKYREKNLDSVAEALLGRRKVALDKPISQLGIDLLAKYNMTDAVLTMELVTHANKLVWNLIVLLMRISKLGLEDVTRSQVSAWIKSLMHWEHRRRGYLIPSKEDILAIGGVARSSAIIKDKKYKGAVVLKPPQGVFFNIVVLDFASLYPSVIKNWNLSYETVNNPNCRGEKRVVPEVKHTVCMEMRGLTSEIVGLLRDFRVRIYKKRAKDKSLPELDRLWYNTVQAAMKVYINASYGVFGNEAFAYYSPSVAESVTAIGRSVLKDTVRKAGELGLMILYGDTDSIFLWSPPRERLEDIIRYVKEKHNLDLEVDKEFTLVLFSGLKKNYLGVTPEGKIVIKGMVGKKSNTPEFLKKEFTRATEILAEVHDPDDLLRAIGKMREHIEEILQRLKRREYTLDELAIRVMLSKDPKEYTKNTPQHVKAALMLRKHGIRVTRGTVVTYVKTRDKIGVRPVKLARLSEVDVGKYTEFVRTAFEQILLALGLSWNRVLGQRKLF